MTKLLSRADTIRVQSKKVASVRCKSLQIWPRTNELYLAVYGSTFTISQSEPITITIETNGTWVSDLI